MLRFQTSVQNSDRRDAVSEESRQAFALPSTLWTTPWIEPFTSEEINVENIESVRDSIFDKAQHPARFDNPPMFELTGSSTSHLAENLVAAIKIALQDNNFENILSPSRDFAMYVLKFIVFDVG